MANLRHRLKGVESRTIEHPFVVFFSAVKGVQFCFVNDRVYEQM